MKKLRVLLLTFLAITFSCTPVVAMAENNNGGWRSWVTLCWAAGATVATACSYMYIKTLKRQLDDQKASMQVLNDDLTVHKELAQKWIECETGYQKTCEDLYKKLDDLQPKRNCTEQAFTWIKDGEVDKVKTNARNIDFSHQDKDERTALHHSLLNKQYKIFNHLLPHARTNQINLADTNNATPLFIAAEDNRSVEVQALISKGADLDVQAKGGATALMMAAAKGHGNIVKTLLAARASMDYKNDQGDTALTLARTHNHKYCIELLRQSLRLNNQASQASLEHFIDDRMLDDGDYVGKKIKFTLKS